MTLTQHSYLASLFAGLLTGLSFGMLRNIYLESNIPYSVQADSELVLYIPENDEQIYGDLSIKYNSSTNDLHMPNVIPDDDTVARKLEEKVRVLCWIMTSPVNLEKKAVHVKKTWSGRCNKALFMSDEDDPDFPATGLGTDLGREHLTAKTMRAFDYIYANHVDDADWFLKADDDTYVVVENLRYLLSDHDPDDPVYFGHHFHVLVKQGYNSGGAGYVLSKEALSRFGRRPKNLCAADKGAEDVEIGRCMERLGVRAGDSRDLLNRSRFHCFPPSAHLLGNYPSWYNVYDTYGAQKGIESISDYPISFHYVSTDQMYELEYVFYHLSAYGIIQGLQPVNKPSLKAQHNSNAITRPE